MTVEAGQAWQRLSPRMLVVHPVHELLRQIPVLIGSLVLGSATGNPMWALFGLALIVGYGLARWFTTSYRIGRRRGTTTDGCASAQGTFGAAQQDPFGVHRRAATASAARVDGAAGEHGSGGQGRHCVRARCGSGRAGTPAEGDSAGGFAGSRRGGRERTGPRARPLAAVLAALQPAELHRAGDDPGRGRAGVSGGSRCGTAGFEACAVRAGRG